MTMRVALTLAIVLLVVSKPEALPSSMVVAVAAALVLSRGSRSALERPGVRDQEGPRSRSRHHRPEARRAVAACAPGRLGAALGRHLHAAMVVPAREREPLERLSPFARGVVVAPKV
jgi:hypothetical protein